MKSEIIGTAVILSLLTIIFLYGVQIGEHRGRSEYRRNEDLLATSQIVKGEHETAMFSAIKTLKECAQTNERAGKVLEKAVKTIDQCMVQLTECRNPAPVLYDHMLPGDPHFSPANDSRKAVELNNGGGGTTNYGEVIISTQPLNCAMDMKGNSTCQ